MVIFGQPVGRVLQKSLSTPLFPQSWGNFVAGGSPQTPTRKFPGSLFQHSDRDIAAKIYFQHSGKVMDCRYSAKKVLKWELWMANVDSFLIQEYLMRRQSLQRATDKISAGRAYFMKKIP